MALHQFLAALIVDPRAFINDGESALHDVDKRRRLDLLRLVTTLVNLKVAEPQQMHAGDWGVIAPSAHIGQYIPAGPYAEGIDEQRWRGHADKQRTGVPNWAAICANAAAFNDHKFYVL